MRHYNPARAARTGQPARGLLSVSQGKMGGRTFGVQPLRWGGGLRAVASVGPGPEVLLSLLPLATLHYTNVTTFQGPDAF